MLIKNTWREVCMKNLYNLMIGKCFSTEFIGPHTVWVCQKNKEWFLQDQVMTSAAFEIDKQIKAEGIAGDSDQYYNELDNRIREYFPNRFSDPQEAKPTEDVKQEQKKPVQTVAPAVRNQNGRRTVKLTKSQLVISKRLGVPPEEYAKYVK